MKKVLDFYRQEWKLFQERRLRTFLLLSVLFVVAIMISLFHFRLHPEAAQKEIKMLDALFGKINYHSQFQILAYILIKNLIASLFTLLLGLIPFFLFPIFPMIINCLTIAAFIHWAGSNSAFLTLTAGILPHGIIEFPVVIYTACLGVRLSLSRTKNRNVMLAVDTLQQEPKHDLPFSRAWKSFALIVIPLLVLAALIETFITPLFLSAATG